MRAKLPERHWDYPPRFKTMEDVNMWYECYFSKKPFPQDKNVCPFIQLPNGDVVHNPEYADAPYELRVITKP